MWVWLTVALVTGASLGLLIGAMLHAAAGADLASRLKLTRLRIDEGFGPNPLLDVSLENLLLMNEWASDDGRFELAKLEAPNGLYRVNLDTYPEEARPK